MTGEEVIKYYNFLVSLMVEGRFRPSYGRRGGFLRFGAKRLEWANAFAAWLEENHFHPPMYLAGAFGSHNWCYQPKADMLKQERYQDAYRDGSAAKWWELVKRNEQSRRPPEELRRAQETIKKRWRDKPAMCLALSDYTGGYNQASELCRTCALAGKCCGDDHSE
jgi:hypothetical protein